MVKTDSMRVAIYARYSTDRQDARSIEDQLRRCRKFAEQHGHVVIQEYNDEAVSGAHLDRAGFQRLLADARRRGGSLFRAVIVDDTSRLSRDLGSAWKVIFEDLASVSVIVIDASTGRSSDDPDAWMSFGMTALINHGFLQMVKHETHRGMEGRALTGFATGGKTYGFATMQEPNTPDPDHPRMVPIIDLDQADIVRRVFHLFVGGTSLKQIASTLNQEKVPAPHDGGRGNKIGNGWPHTTIRSMLLNERYTGRQTWNRCKWERVSGKKKRRRVERPQSEWIVKDVPELRIISDELWFQVQARFQRSASKSKRGRPAGTGKYISLLSGLLRCGVCQGGMTVVSRKFKDGIPYSNFGCTSHASRGDAICANNRVVSELRAASAIVGALRLALIQPEMIKRFTETFQRRLIELHGHKDEGVKDLDRKIREAQSRVRNVCEAVASTGWKESLGIMLDEEEAHLTSLKQQRDALADDSPAKVIPHPKVIEGYLHDLLGVLEADPVRGRELLARHLGPVLMTPEGEGTERCYRVTGAFNLSVAISLAGAKNSKAPDSVESGAVKCGSGGRI